MATAGTSTLVWCVKTSFPPLEKARRPFDALLAQRAEFYDSTLINMDSGRGYDPNMIYGSSYFDAIDRLSADSLKAYYTYLHSPAREAWQKLWKPTSFAGKEFYYDLMGTRLLRECRFAEAIPYLEKRASPSSRRKHCHLCRPARL